MVIRKITGKIHLWLGLTSGLVVLFLGITGCLLAFQKEIESVTNTYQYVQKENKAYLPPSVLKNIAAAQLPTKKVHSVTYGLQDKAAQVAFFNFSPDYYYIVYLNPYSGQVLKVKNMNRDFFRVVITGHYYLWLPPAIGQPIVATATLIFVIMLITGIVLWWPKNKAARKQRFSIKWSARWRRVNYDLHNVLGFYISWVVIFTALTGMVMGFQWFRSSVYTVTSGGKEFVDYAEPVSATPKNAATAVTDPVDKVWLQIKATHPAAQLIEVHFPESKEASIAVNVNPDAATFYKTDFRFFDQYTLQELPVTHPWGRYKDASVADKIQRMNYDIHIGAIWGLPGKCLAFFASLIAASLPVTGFLVWRGRKKKKKAANKIIPKAALEVA